MGKSTINGPFSLANCNKLPEGTLHFDRIPERSKLQTTFSCSFFISSDCPRLWAQKALSDHPPDENSGYSIN